MCYSVVFCNESIGGKLQANSRQKGQIPGREANQLATEANRLATRVKSLAIRAK